VANSSSYQSDSHMCHWLLLSGICDDVISKKFYALNISCINICFLTSTAIPRKYPKSSIFPTCVFFNPRNCKDKVMSLSLIHSSLVLWD